MLLQSAQPFDLIMSSGFLCFSSHCGMLRALEQTGREPDAFVGTSSGALAAAMSAAGLSAEDVAKELGGQRPISLCRLGKPSRSGFVSTRALERRLRSVLPPTFEDLPKPLAVGIYRLPPKDDPSGYIDPGPLLVTSGDLPRAVVASCAVPRLFKPLALTGKAVSAGTTLALPGVASTTTLRRPKRIELQYSSAAPDYFYADGGAVDRTMCDAWRAWRPEKKGLVHLVSNKPYGEYGPRDGLADPTNVLGVVRTPRARASFLSLRDFDAQVDAAAELAGVALEQRIGWPAE